MRFFILISIPDWLLEIVSFPWEGDSCHGKGSSTEFQYSVKPTSDDIFFLQKAGGKCQERQRNNYELGCYRPVGFLWWCHANVRHGKGGGLEKRGMSELPLVIFLLTYGRIWLKTQEGGDRRVTCEVNCMGFSCGSPEYPASLSPWLSARLRVGRGHQAGETTGVLQALLAVYGTTCTWVVKAIAARPPSPVLLGFSMHIWNFCWVFILLIPKSLFYQWKFKCLIFHLLWCTSWLFCWKALLGLDSFQG